MNTRIRRVSLAAGFCGIAMIPGFAAGQFAIPSHTIDNGGRTSCGGAGFSLSGTIGQPDAGPSTGPMMGAGFRVRGGFWEGVASPCPGDATGDGVANFADITRVLENWNMMYGCGAATPGDADRNGVVNFADITKVLENFNLACN